MVVAPASTPLIGLLFAGGVLFIALLISASFLLWAARLVGIANRTLGRALAAIVLGGIASAVVRVLMTASTMSNGIGIVAGMLVSAIVTMGLFQTTFGKALAANIIAWVLGAVVVVVLSMVMAFLLAFVAGAAPA